MIYGRFELGSDFNAGNHLALWILRADSKKEYFIRFNDADLVCCISVNAGRYNVVGFVGTDSEHRIWGRKKFPASFPFEVRTNSATYIGDFAGRTTYDFGGMLQEWKIKGITNNFAGTTEDFRRNFPNLISVPVYSAFGRQSLWLDH